MEPDLMNGPNSLRLSLRRGDVDTAKHLQLSFHSTTLDQKALRHAT